MESTTCPEFSSTDASDSANITSPPISGHPEESETSQNTHSTGSLEAPVLLDPSLQRGRAPLGTRMALAFDQSQNAAHQFNQPQGNVPKAPSSNLSLLIFTAVATCQKKSGLSMPALKKIVTNMGYDMAKKKRYFLRSIKGMVAKGQLWQVKGVGATGSFKVNPDLGKKMQESKVRGRGRKLKEPSQKKVGPARSRSAKNQGKVAKNQGKVDAPKRASNKSRMGSVQGVRGPVKV